MDGPQKRYHNTDVVVEKDDISAFRFELIEIMRSSGMNTSSATGTGGGKDNLFISFTIIITRAIKTILVYEKQVQGGAKSLQNSQATLFS